MLDTILWLWTTSTSLVGSWYVGRAAGKGLISLAKRRNARAEAEAAAAEPELPPLSWASERVLSQYEGLPADQQRVPELESIVRALDVKHGRTELDWHAGGYTKGWTYHSTCDHISRKSCILREHFALWRSIQEVKDELADRERTLELAGVRPDLDRLEDALADLRQEKRFIRESTENIT